MVDIKRADRSYLTWISLGIALIGLCSFQFAEAKILPSVKARAPQAEAPRPAGLPSDAELQQQEARIGEIRFDARDLFDTEASDEDTQVSRLANRLHVTTRQGTIEDQLLFKSGDLYQPHLLEESARILRDTRYLRDAQVRPVAYHDGVVDIEVLTRDTWSLDPGVSAGRSGCGRPRASSTKDADPVRDVLALEWRAVATNATPTPAASRNATAIRRTISQ